MCTGSSPLAVIRGVPSCCAVSAKLGDCLVETSQALHVIPGVYGNLKEQLMLPGTKVLMKSGRAFAEVRETIREAGLSNHAMMIENCGFDSERMYRNLDDADESAGYFSVIVVKDKESEPENPS
jgi:precorrin-2/cobalt-factor-2 C20-methyltransferase